MSVKTKPSLGVIGGGFVGGTFAEAFQHYTEVKLFDLDKERCTHSYGETIAQDVLVMALPTPMRQSDGSVDVGIVERALTRLEEELVEPRPVLLRSTVPPDPLIRWGGRFKKVKLYYCPEFLTERTARHDFQQSNRIIIGTRHGMTQPTHLEDRNVEKVLGLRFPQVPIYWVSYSEASLIKYMTNVFFCTKIAILNEFAQVCEEYGLDFNSVFGKVMLDTRIGKSHFQVPGHDGKRGFGGHCFPKDLNGFIRIAKDAGVVPTVAMATWAKNLEVRPEQDWLGDVGRAVSEEESEEEDVGS
jgi:UDPglucose 6-dehydrogenase